MREEREIALAKENEERKAAEAKASEEKRIADEKAAEEKRIADEKAAEQARLLAAEAERRHQEREAARIESERLAHIEREKDPGVMRAKLAQLVRILQQQQSEGLRS